MSLDNMTFEEVQFWAKGESDALLAAEKNGLWVCPECSHLMPNPPQSYSICPHCRKEFGYDEVKMLHIGLNSDFWHWRDVLFVITGWV
jgi:hypothetical protein